MELFQSFSVIGDFFRITYIENPGMAFGINFGNDSKLFLTIFSIVASVGIIIYLYKVRRQIFILRFSLALILGGAVGNLIDRIFYGVLYDSGSLFYGKVVDFFDFDFFDITFLGNGYDRWPIFNIADMSVSIGVLLLIIFYNKISKAEEEVKVNTKNEVVLPETDIQSSLIPENVSFNSNDSQKADEGVKSNNELNNGEKIKI